MRTAEKILEEYWNKKNYMQAYFIDQQTAILTAINEARKEAIEECAKRAKVTDPYQDGRRIGLRYDNLENYIQNNPAKINKQSILSLINELK